MALLPIGMVAVGSVNFEESVTAGTRVEKGDMLGHFAFGVQVFNKFMTIGKELVEKEMAL